MPSFPRKSMVVHRFSRNLKKFRKLANLSTPKFLEEDIGDGIKEEWGC